ncbi:YWFCY domain-containing protein [Chryseobacterium oleae]|uniref:YWFCY domain-containing protein n=1 Tax=Chryseobacterium oleae TaxID=491207 RepID=UPI000B7D8343
MLGEDDLRDLEKIMEFMRAVFVLIYNYWFHHSFLQEYDLVYSTVDTILMNFHQRQACFHIHFTPKTLAVILLILIRNQMN